MALNKGLSQEHSNLSLNDLLFFFIMFETGAWFLTLSKNDTSKSFFGAAACSPAPPISFSVSKPLFVSLATGLEGGKENISF